MTTDQAVAILEAERELQGIGSDGPDCSKGGAWYGYVDEAVQVIDADEGYRKYYDTFNDLHLVRSVRIIHRNLDDRP